MRKCYTVHVYGRECYSNFPNSVVRNKQKLAHEWYSFCFHADLEGGEMTVSSHTAKWNEISNFEDNEPVSKAERIKMFETRWKLLPAPPANFTTECLFTSHATVFCFTVGPPSAISASCAEQNGSHVLSFRESYLFLTIELTVYICLRCALYSVKCVIFEIITWEGHRMKRTQPILS